MNKKIFTFEKFLGLVFVITGLVVSINGVAEFDDAITLISFLRGLFWMTIGLLCFFSGLDRLKND